MDPNHTSIPAWRNPPQKTRTVKRWRPSDLQLQYLWEIYDEETDTPSKDRLEQIIAHLKEDRRSERQKVIDDLRNHKPATDFIITDADMQSWFQNRKRENSIKRGDSIEPSLSCEDGESVTSWRPNEEQLEILWYVYDHGNCTPPLARRKVTVEALRQAQRQPATDSRKENRDKLEEHRPATFTISDRNVKAWLDNRYRDKRLREKRIPHRMLSINLSSKDREPGFSPRKSGESDFFPRDQSSDDASSWSTSSSKVPVLETRLQIINLLYYDPLKVSPDKARVQEIIATFSHQDEETNAIIDGLLLTEAKFGARLQCLKQLYREEDRAPDKALLKKIITTMRMCRPIAEMNVKLRALIATQDGWYDQVTKEACNGCVIKLGASSNDDGDSDFSSRKSSGVTS